MLIYTYDNLKIGDLFFMNFVNKTIILYNVCNNLKKIDKTQIFFHI